MQKFPDQWNALTDIITSRNPKKIALDYSNDFGHADGLDHTEYTQLVEKITACIQIKNRFRGKISRGLVRNKN